MPITHNKPRAARLLVRAAATPAAEPLERGSGELKRLEMPDNGSISMRRLVAALVVSLSLCGVARGETFPPPGMSPNGSNATLPTARYNLHIGNYASPYDYDPQCDGSSTTHDCSTAINTAAAVTQNGVSVNVHLQAGQYYLAHAVTFTAGQCLYGDSRGNTTLLIDQGFDSVATQVVGLSAGGLDPGPCVHDLGIAFAQPSDQSSRASFLTLAQGCTSGTGGSGCKYPPAISALSNSSRYKVWNVRISRAWDGINSNGVNAVWWLDDIEMSSLDIGLNMGGTKDFSHIKGFPVWNFDISSASNLYTGVFTDGNNYAAQFGEMDGLSIVDFTDFHGRIYINSAAGWFQFTNLMLDSGNADLEVNSANWVQVTNVYSTGVPSGANTACPINVASGVVIVENYYEAASTTALCVSGGTVNLTGGALSAQSTGITSVSQSGGTLSVRNVTFNPNTGAGSWTVPLINVTSGVLQAQDNFFSAAPTNVGAISLNADNASHIVTGNNFNGWSFTAPGYLGTYGPNNSGSLIAVKAVPPTGGALTTPIQALGNTAVTSSFGAARFSADAGGSGLVLGKSRNGSINGHTIVNASDTLGAISFDGDDGSALVVSSSINATVDSLCSGPGSGKIPGRLAFSTANNSGALTERLRLDCLGDINFINGPLTNYKITNASKTSNYSVSVNDSGSHFDNSGASGEVDFTLPVAAAGLNYCFTVYAAQTLKLLPGNATDRIAVAASNSTANTGSVSANATFASICIEAHGTGQWITNSTADKTQWTVSDAANDNYRDGLLYDRRVA